jgi:hypothetical protein
MITIGVEPEYRVVVRLLFGWDTKGVPNAPIATRSEVVNFMRLLKLIQRLDSSMITIGVELEYRSVARSLSVWVQNESPVPR